MAVRQAEIYQMQTFYLHFQINCVCGIYKVKIIGSDSDFHPNLFFKKNRAQEIAVIIVLDTFSHHSYFGGIFANSLVHSSLSPLMVTIDTLSFQFYQRSSENERTCDKQR